MLDSKHDKSGRVKHFEEFSLHFPYVYIEFRKYTCFSSENLKTMFEKLKFVQVQPQQ